MAVEAGPKGAQCAQVSLLSLLVVTAAYTYHNWQIRLGSGVYHTCWQGQLHVLFCFDMDVFSLPNPS